MKTVILAFALLGLSSCASQQIMKEKEARHYSQADRDVVDKYTMESINEISSGTAASNAFNPMNAVKSTEIVQKYFCACRKKLAERCAQNSEAVEAKDRELWAKGAGAEWALKATGNRKYTDPILCE